MSALGDWLFHRALRASTKDVIKLAKATGQSPAKVTALNDAVAGIVAAHAEAVVPHGFEPFTNTANTITQKKDGP